jgi:hypothetical protein
MRPGSNATRRLPAWLVACIVATTLITLAAPALPKAVQANRVTASASASITILRDRQCVIPVPDPLPECGSTLNELCVRVMSTEYTYEWEILSAPAGWELTDQLDERCVIYSAGEHGDATFLVTLVDEQGASHTCDVTFSCQMPTEYCTRSQGFYGNKGGKHDGMGTLVVLESLITPDQPLVVGVPGTRSLTIPDESEQCVIDRLPAGGPSCALPDFGDQTIGADCDTDPTGMPIKNKRFRNNLLGQVITLTLNVRLNWPADFAAVELCPEMTTLPPLDSHGDSEECTISQAVLDALADLGLHRTVGGLLELANRALAGVTDLGGVSHSEIGQAVATVNECFEGCRVFEGCTDPAGTKLQSPLLGPPGHGDRPTIPAALDRLSNAPNPVREGTAIRYGLPEASHVTLTIHNLRGQVVAVLKDEEVPAGSHTEYWHTDGNAPVASGVYFYSIEVTGLESGEKSRQARKLIVVR